MFDRHKPWLLDRICTFLVLLVTAGPPAASAAPFAYVANQFSPSVSVIDTATDAVVPPAIPIDVSGSEPIRLKQRPDSVEVWVAVHQAKRVDVIDTTTNAVDPSPVPQTLEGQVYDVAFDPCGRWGYALTSAPAPSSATDPGRLYTLDLATRQAISSIQLGRYPQRLVVASDCSRVYVFNGGAPADLLGGKISVVDVATSSIAKLEDLSVSGAAAGGLALSATGTTLYVSTGDGDVAVLNTAALSDPPIVVPVCEGPCANDLPGLTLSPSGTELYASCTVTRKVWVIDTTSNTLSAGVNPIDVGPSVGTCGCSPESFTGCLRGGAFTPDGLKFYVTAGSAANPGTLAVVDTTARTPGTAIPVGAGPADVTVVTVQTCGNGVIEGTEQCDDDNTAAGDGCSGGCAVEPGWVCEGEPSACVMPCPGHCGAELSTTDGQKAVEKYLKTLLGELAQCAKKGDTTCPCPTPKTETLLAKLNGTLTSSCSDLLYCQGNRLMASAVGSAWSPTGRCHTGTALTKCGTKASSSLGKLATTHLKRRRTHKLPKTVNDTRTCVRSLAKVCSGSSTSAEIACAQASRVARTIVSPAHCATLSFDHTAAVDALQTASLALEVPPGPHVWDDGIVFNEITAEAAVILGCHLEAPPSLSGAASALQARRGLLDSLPTQYCGPLTSNEHPALHLLQPGPCLEVGCERHDACYGNLEQTECVDTTACMWSPLTHECDKDFYSRFSFCFLTLRCNADCRLAGAIVADIALYQRLNGSCDVGGAYDCAACANGCCSDEGYSDCEYTGCGNSMCGLGETCASCIQDCAVARNCPPVCPDGYCDFLDGESCLTCPADCSDNLICGTGTTLCEPVTERTLCYTGPAGTENVGRCRAGEASCNLLGTAFGTCQDEVTPTTEVCGNGIDEDCNGSDLTCQGCTPNSTQACSTGQAGICSAGTQTCNAQGTAYGSCVPNLSAGTETIGAGTCSNGLDDDCDGTTDGSDSGCQTSCVCTPGSTQACSTGLLGVCSAGTRTCNAQCTGYGSCVPNQSAGTETIGAGTCSNGLDDDCDGATDGSDSGCQTSCVCTPGSTQACSTGLLGVCSAGTQTCNAQCTGYGACVQNQQAGTEGPEGTSTCSNGTDDDCDGLTDCNDGGCFITERVTNGGFEQGWHGWGNSGNFFADARFPTRAHNGTSYAYLSLADGTPGNSLSGAFSQTVSVPACASTATVTMWISVNTAETIAAAFDFLYILVNGVLVETIDNREQPPIGNTPFYLQHSYDVSSARGTSFSIAVTASTDSSNPTIFRVDDVSLVVTP